MLLKSSPSKPYSMSSETSQALSILSPRSVNSGCCWLRLPQSTSRSAAGCGCQLCSTAIKHFISAGKMFIQLHYLNSISCSSAFHKKKKIKELLTSSHFLMLPHFSSVSMSYIFTPTAPKSSNMNLCALQFLLEKVVCVQDLCIISVCKKQR